MDVSGIDGEGGHCVGRGEGGALADDYLCRPNEQYIPQLYLYCLLYLHHHNHGCNAPARQGAKETESLFLKRSSSNHCKPPDPQQSRREAFAPHIKVL